MRNMCLGITAIVVTIGMASVGAQGRNFSGTWVIDSEKTMAEMRAIIGDTAGAVVTRGGSGGAGGAMVSSGGSGGVVAGGGGGGVSGGGSAVGTMSAAGGGGGRAGGGGAMVSSDTVIALDATTFTTNIGGIQTSYPLNGTEVTVQVRNSEARAKASWKGDALVIEQTIDSPNGPLTTTSSWFLEGDNLVRETTRKTYYKRK